MTKGTTRNAGLCAVAQEKEERSVLERVRACMLDLYRMSMECDPCISAYGFSYHMQKYGRSSPRRTGTGDTPSLLTTMPAHVKCAEIARLYLYLYVDGMNDTEAQARDGIDTNVITKDWHEARRTVMENTVRIQGYVNPNEYAHSAYVCMCIGISARLFVTATLSSVVSESDRRNETTSFLAHHLRKRVAQTLDLIMSFVGHLF